MFEIIVFGHYNCRRRIYVRGLCLFSALRLDVLKICDPQETNLRKGISRRVVHITVPWLELIHKIFWSFFPGRN